MRTRTLLLKDWRRFVGGDRVLLEDEKGQRDAENFLADKILRPYYEEASNAARCLLQLRPNERSIPELIAETAFRRWGQIQFLLRDGVSNGIGEPTRTSLLKSFDKFDTAHR